MHALDLEGTEETPLRIELGDDYRLTLPRKPRKRQVSSFPEWARCFGVYAHYLTSHQPLRSTDLFAYMYIIATCHAEYTFSACMAYDVAFRRWKPAFSPVALNGRVKICRTADSVHGRRFHFLPLNN